MAGSSQEDGSDRGQATVATAAVATAAAASPWGGLGTEGRHPASGDLDTLEAAEIVDLMLTEDRRGLDAARRVAGDVARAADRFAETLAGGGDVVFAGAGTSGRLGVLEAAECPPTFGTDPRRIRAILAGGPDAVFRSREGAEDDADDGRAQVRGIGEGDLLVGLSASSVTPFVRGALDQARRQGAGTVLLTCAAGEGLEDAADLVLALDTGPEVLTGSTRLKAGSATKAVLNSLTTAAMVRLGKVFENLMVDLAPGSAKLRDRARRIVAAGGRVSSEEAERLLGEAGGEVKTAIVMARRGGGADSARRLLATADGNVRQALAGGT